jgi:uncharacterized membrane protein (DUF4010 family)
MTEIEIFLRILLALGLGLLVGMEREKFAKKRDRYVFGGIRTFALISLLGSISGLFVLEGNFWVMALSFSALSAMVLMSYFYAVRLSNGKGIGLTGEIAALIVFFSGQMVFTEHILLSVAISIITATFLFLKERLHEMLKKASEEEIYSTLVFAIIAFVILPFLPDKAYGPLGVLNPRTIWSMVVLVCAIGYIGYFLIRILGPKTGVGLTGFLGGLVSSTAVTMNLAEKSKEEKGRDSANMLVFGTIIANTVMFGRVAVIVFIVSSNLFFELLPALLVMAIVGIAFAGYHWQFSKKNGREAKVRHKSPFSLMPALQFGAFFAFVLFALKAGQLYLGSLGIYAASLLSGFVDVDAVVLSSATIAGLEITTEVAATAIILAVMSNTIIKIGYAYVFGSREFSRKVGLALGLMAVLGLAAVLVF